MLAYRISKPARARDLSGTGARLYGGRWNPKGIPLVYASTTPALALLEFLAHTPLHLAPPEIACCTLAIPDGEPNHEIGAAELPPDWRSYPAPPALASLGRRWCKAAEHLTLTVPSVLLPVGPERNVLVNSLHEAAGKVAIVSVEVFSLDDRPLAEAASLQVTATLRQEP